MKMFSRVSLSRSICVLVCLSCYVRPNLSSVPLRFDFIQIEGETFSECSRWNVDALSCFTFDLTLVNREIQAVKLMFHKRENINNANKCELLLYDLGPLNGYEERIGEKRVISREVVKTNATVVQIDLTDVVKSWTTPVAETIIIAFKYNNSESVFNVSDGNRPSLAVIYSEAQLSRRRVTIIREGPCDTRYRCCLINQTVTFNVMGMPSIIAPSTMNIRRCGGVCNDPHEPSTRNALYWTRYSMSLSAIERWSAGSPICCAPMEYQPASILYFNENRTVESVIADEVQVTRCGCI